MARPGTNVTPPAMTAWSKVSQVEAGHFDAETRLTRQSIGIVWRTTSPYIYRTHDGGKTWQNVVRGIPDGAYVNSVKEDPETKGPAVRRHRTARLRLVR